MNEEKINEIFDGFADPEINDSNIIQRYIRVVSGNNTVDLPGLTDAPRRFIESTALFLVSTFMRRNFAMASLAKSQFFVKTKNYTKDNNNGIKFNDFFNLWFIILGKSRVGRKSVTMAFMQQIIEQVFPELEISYTFTPQALIKNLAEEKWVEKKDGSIETPFTWIQDECTIFFDQLKKADFMASTDGLLSKFYDGKTFTDSTISRGTKKVTNPYCTSFLASTPILPKAFTEKLLMQGLLNRFCFIVEENIEFRDERIGGTFTDKEEEERVIITDWFDTLNSLVLPTVVQFKPEARKLYSQFTRRIEKIINDKSLGLREPYFGNLPNLLKRLSGVYQIAELSDEELLNLDNEIEITENSMLWALDYLEYLWQGFEKVLDLMEKREPKYQPAVYHKDRNIEILNGIVAVYKRYILNPESYGIKNLPTKMIVKLSHLRLECDGLEGFEQGLDELSNAQKIIKHTGYNFSQKATIGIEYIDYDVEDLKKILESEKS